MCVLVAFVSIIESIKLKVITMTCRIKTVETVGRYIELIEFVKRQPRQNWECENYLLGLGFECSLRTIERMNKNLVKIGVFSQKDMDTRGIKRVNGTAPIGYYSFEFVSIPSDLAMLTTIIKKHLFFAKLAVYYLIDTGVINNVTDAATIFREYDIKCSIRTIQRMFNDLYKAGYISRIRHKKAYSMPLFYKPNQ